MQFSAKLTCPLGDPTKTRETRFRVDDGSLASSSITLVVMQNLCSWKGFQIGGQEVRQSVMTGAGPFYSDGTWSAEGYDFGTLANGDHYLAQWKEKGDSKAIKGTWKLLMGTGSLEGITGEATFEEPAPKQGDTSVTADVTGWYEFRR